MKQENKRKYETPAMTMVSFSMEQGFEGSGGSRALGLSFDAQNPSSNGGDHAIEDRSDVEYNWEGTGNDGWI